MNGILTLLLLTSVVTDLMYGKIYNMLVFPAMSAGVLLRLEEGGIRALVPIAFSLGIAMLLLPFHWIGKGMGGGDIKLLMAIACLTDPACYLQCFAASFLIGGILALITLIDSGSRKAAIPVAVPVAAGTMAVLLQPYVTQVSA